MAKSVRERVRECRKKRLQRGGRTLSALLDSEEAQMLDDLLKHYGESISPLIARAIRTLYEVTCDGGDSPQPHSPGDHQAGETPADEAPKRVRTEDETKSPVERPQAEQDLLFLEIRSRCTQSMQFKDVKKPLLEWIKTMRARHISFELIAEKLNEAEVPTPSGKGVWESGMIPTLLLLN